MSITLVTGKPGAGKTLFVVSEIVNKLGKEGRDVFASIDGLDFDKLGVQPLHPDGVSEKERVEACRKWNDVPPNSVIIIDECQRVFPPRNPMSTVPEYISLFETHRHKGYDVWIITQHPSLIDRHLHALIDRHIHFTRTFNAALSVKREWTTVVSSPEPEKNEEDASKTQFRYPKDVYQFYKSASHHTMKLRIPKKGVVLVGGFFGSVALVAFMMWRSGGVGPIRFDGQPEEAEPTIQPQTSKVAVAPVLLDQPQIDTECRWIVKSRAGQNLTVYDLKSKRKLTINLDDGFMTVNGAEGSRIIPAGKSGAICS